MTTLTTDKSQCLVGEYYNDKVTLIYSGKCPGNSTAATSPGECETFARHLGFRDNLRAENLQGSPHRPHGCYFVPGNEFVSGYGFNFNPLNTGVSASVRRPV
jgi:hypothetical protein